MKPSWKIDYILLNEMSIAKEGNWDDEIKEIGNYSEVGFKNTWKFVDKIKIPKLSKSFDFYRLNSENTFILGYWTTETIKTKIGNEEKNIFRAIFKISLTKYNYIANKLQYKKLSNVDGVYLLSEYRNNNIAVIVYKYLVNIMNYTILGDEKQYFGARRLWSRLSKELDVEVDIIDVKNEFVIETNIILHHGNYDKDFDNRLWSYKDDKKHIRSVLRKIK